LPENWRFVAHLDPFFHLIDGFRYGFIGHADGTLWISATILIVVNAALLALCFSLISRGYKLKA
jgi:ABC-2 type transport system permease protein